MSIKPDRVKRIIKAFEGVYPEGITSNDLGNLLEVKVSNLDKDPELVYCQQKDWVEKTEEGWFVTAKGVDAYIAMKKGKECFEIGDP